ncbi:MAG: Zn-dependent hydrolase [Acidobacteria bacterium]|nr:Zn-dependent hydrolase [Acidobacteriota bacterium]
MSRDWSSAARLCIARCRELASFTEEPGRITRTYLSPPMHHVHRALRGWLQRCGAAVSIDAAGNLRALLGPGNRPRLLIGSHLDTVPNAGAFDGILGVVLGVAMLEAAGELTFDVEVVGFSEEEGVRYGIPFIGSRAAVGLLDQGTIATISAAIRDFGLDPAEMPAARISPKAAAFLEVHIEQGPVLENLDLPLGVVTAIAAQSRAEIVFQGSAAHAGTTPAAHRKDALAAACEWVGAVERAMVETPGLMATAGRITAEPGARNVIAGRATATLDIRHASGDVRTEALERLTDCAHAIALRRGLDVSVEIQSAAPATAMDSALTDVLAAAAAASGTPALRMVSGAGHDAMILAPHVPSTMLFVRSSGGSHCPEESVRERDVAAALACGFEFMMRSSREGLPHA